MSYIIAHRGACHFAPENTVAAFREAVKLGVDGIETDIHMTKDLELVVHHNYTLDGTTSCTGRICDYTLAELKQMDFGSYKGAEFSGAQIATLSECLDAVSDLKIINLELKSPLQTGVNYVERVIEEVIRHELVEKVILSSFNHNLLKQAKQICPEIRVGALTFANCVEIEKFINIISNIVPKDTPLKDLDIETLHFEAVTEHIDEIDIVMKDKTALLKELFNTITALAPESTLNEIMLNMVHQSDLFEYIKNLDFKVEYLHPNFQSLLIDRDLVTKLNTIGVKVTPYTPDEQDLITLLKNMGCYGIITNRPDLAL